MYVNLENFYALNTIYERIQNVFENIKPQKDMSIDDVVKLYAHDEIFLMDLKTIRNSMDEITEILAPIESLKDEFSDFLSIKIMIVYLLDNLKLFLKNISFVDNLLLNFFELINKKLQSDNEYVNYYNAFSTFLENQKEIFYLEIFHYSGEYEKGILKINNLFNFH
ncbi:MAG: hypothetical protein IJ122_09125 [Methanobrevibacter sp.]|nr:hypothetical protein [Methanobrevibacter sp.]